MKRHLLDKVWELHKVDTLPTGQDQVFIGLHLIHEVTSPQAFAMLKQRGLKVLYPQRTFATLTVFIRDLKEIVGIILQLWFWFTPIVYVREILPEFVRRIMVFNPAYIFIESYQRIFVFNDIPSVKSLLLLAVLTHLMLGLAYLTFRFLEKDVRDFL